MATDSKRLSLRRFQSGIEPEASSPARAVADGDRVSLARLLMLSGPEGERRPILYGVALSIWLIVAAAVAGLAFMPLLRSSNTTIWDFPDPFQLNLAKIPALAFGYLKASYAPSVFIPVAVVAVALVGALLLLLTAKYGLTRGKRAMHFLVVFVEVVIIAAFCYSQFARSDFYIALRSPFIIRLTSMEWDESLLLANIVALGWLLVLADSYIVASRMRVLARASSSLVLAVAAFYFIPVAVPRVAANFRVDSPLATLTTIHLLVATPIVLLVLMAVALVPEVLRFVERRTRSAAGMIVAFAAAGGMLIIAPILSSASTGQHLNPLLAKLNASPFYTTRATDTRVYAVFYNDGRIDSAARTVNSDIEKTVAEAAALGPADAKLPVAWEKEPALNPYRLSGHIYNGVDITPLFKNIMRANPGMVFSYFGLPQIDGWAYLDTGETADVAALAESAPMAPPETDLWLAQVYYWQGDYPMAKLAFARAEKRNAATESAFASRAEMPVYVQRRIDRGVAGGLAKAPADADVVKHDVKFIARLDGKPLAGLSVGISADVLMFGVSEVNGRKYRSYASYLTRYIKTDANGGAQMNGVVSGPCAVAVTLSTDAMGFIPGDRALVVNATNLDRRTSAPATVTIDFAPSIARTQEPPNFTTLQRTAPTSVPLAWKPVAGAAKYRIAGESKVLGETPEPRYNMPIGADLVAPQYAIVALTADGRMIGSDLSLDRLARGATPTGKPTGHSWRRLTQK